MNAPDPITRLNAALEGRYHIERELGAGGMATVYLAADLRHERNVALKVLKPELAAVVGAERFLAEIKTTANLQHPHILQLHDSGEADGFLYFVMPYVEGETLRARIDREKQLPVEEAVSLARAVSAALQAAHEQGVIHRDIKPANILLSHGEPLVADFGIALAVQQAGGGRLTETGLSLGTPYYMSPEQATADRDPDSRSDIYSLGSVLFEMLTGEPPFTGNTAQAVLGKILTGAPARPTEYRKSIPPHIESVILKSLERVPADRFGSASDFGKALGDPAFRHGVHEGGDLDPAAAAGAAVASLQRRVRVLAGAAVALIAALGWTLLGRTGDAGGEVVEFYVQGDSTHEVVSGFPGSLALSPDGRTLAYTGRSEGTRRIYLRRLDERDPRALLGTEGANSLFFSHDGSWLGYGTEGFDVFKVRVAGGSPTSVARLGNTLTNGFWAEDGYIYYGETGLPGLMRVSEDGGVPEELFPQSDSITGLLDPWVLPGGDVVVASILSRGTQLLSYDLRDGTSKILGPGMNPRFVDDHLVYGTDEGVVLAQPFDPRSLEFVGDPVRIADAVGGWLNISRDLAISPSGAFAFAAGLSGLSELSHTRWSPSRGDVVTTAASLRTPRISPNRDQVLYGSGTSADIDIYLASLSQGTSRLLATLQGSPGASWSPDGTSIVYAGGLTNPAIWTMDIAGGGEAELRYTPDFVWTAALPHYTWDGEELVFERGPVPRDIVALALDGSGELRTVVSSPGDESQSVPSPTGPWVAYSSTETGRSEVYVAPLGGGVPVPVSNAGGLSPAWSETGDTLYYYPLGAGTELATAALTFDGAPRVVARGSITTIVPLVEVNTLPAQYDMYSGGLLSVAASQIGGRIVVRTNYLPSGS